MTWISNKNMLLLFISLIFVSGVSGSHYYQNTGSGEMPEGFSVPEYESQGEILTELVAPFLAIAVVLQIGFYKVLSITLDTNRDPYHYRDKDKNVRKQSMVLSLVITGMLVPSPFWSVIRQALQGLALVSIAGLFVAVLVFFYYLVGLGGGGDQNNED